VYVCGGGEGGIAEMEVLGSARVCGGG